MLLDTEPESPYTFTAIISYGSVNTLIPLPVKYIHVHVHPDTVPQRELKQCDAVHHDTHKFVEFAHKHVVYVTMYMHMYIYMYMNHGGARQAWTAAISSQLALISREYA